MRFLDTNVLIYAQQSHAKGAAARAILSQGGIISIQALNEFTSVSRTTLQLPWADIVHALDDIAWLLPPPGPLQGRPMLPRSEFAGTRDTASTMP